MIILYPGAMVEPQSSCSERILFTEHKDHTMLFSIPVRFRECGREGREDSCRTSPALQRMMALTTRPPSIVRLSLSPLSQSRALVRS